MSAAKPFKVILIAADDEFLAAQRAQALFEAAAASVGEFGTEVILAQAQNVAEVEAVVGRAIEAMRTMPMFGDQKVIWVRSLNFLADSVTGRAEGTQIALARFLEALSEIKDGTQVIISAFPVDRRRKEFKALDALCKSEYLSGGTGENFSNFVATQAKAAGLNLSHDAAELLGALVHGNTRMATSEIEKLSVYMGDDRTSVSAALVSELVAPFGESEFFQAAEVFFKGNLSNALTALDDHFFSHPEARPLLTTLQGRTRLLIALKALMDAGFIKSRGLSAASLQSAIEKAGAGQSFSGIELPKSTFNLISQNPWYLGKIAESASHWTLKRLIDCQKSLLRAFVEILERPTEQKDVLTECYIRCLGKQVN
jgi:DNA polymerase III subunit delta